LISSYSNTFIKEGAERDAQTSDQTDQIRDGDHGRAVGAEQWIDPRDSREFARKEAPSLHHSTNNHPSPGGEERGATDQAGRQRAHLRAGGHARGGAWAFN